MNIEDIRTGDRDFSAVGFQATQLARAVEIVKQMKKERAAIFLAFTSNMVASGLRGIIAELCRKKFVDVVVTAGGSLDHDLIKSYMPYTIGDFSMDDAALHKKGINRLGNILILNKCYELLEKKMQGVFEELYKRQKLVSPSEIAHAIGKSIKNKNSFLYWCNKNNIPVFSPGITDSAIGLQAYFFKQRHKDFGIDVTKDMPRLAQLVLNADRTGAIILGGGISKHHILGANILRGGLDYAVYITTASPFDGSLSGARTQEAISWSKLKEHSNYVTVDCDATIAFPLLMAGVFRK
ncbi:MAG TPA: deoxyhypusine synthase [Candidatus Bilamarchaeaceae archaeon]|nr:deoxyhypusine synthase [Candidatus Bilamarchaeaceae archaeon]